MAEIMAHERGRIVSYNESISTDLLQ